MPHVSQSRLIDFVLPMIEAGRCRFRKSLQIHARPAIAGETIVSVTSDGVETSNVADAGDRVVRNLTSAGELYIISARSFPHLYEHVDDLADGWALYNPKGEVLALEVTERLAADLGVGAEFQIEAPWGSDERVRIGDYLAAPLPALTKVYRIARVEFAQTYSPVLTD